MSLWRRAVAELLGTGALVTRRRGVRIAAQRLSPGDPGLQLLENSTATAFGLAVLVLVLAPVSGAHLNPVVSAVDWLQDRRPTRRSPAARWWCTPRRRSAARSRAPCSPT